MSRLLGQKRLGRVVWLALRKGKHARNNHHTIGAGAALCGVASVLCVSVLERITMRIGSRVIYTTEYGWEFGAVILEITGAIAHLQFDDGDEGWERLDMLRKEERTLPGA